jgi:hypothetical protein
VSRYSGGSSPIQIYTQQYTEQHSETEYIHKKVIVDQLQSELEYKDYGHVSPKFLLIWLSLQLSQQLLGELFQTQSQETSEEKMNNEKCSKFLIKANSHMPCRAPTILRQCRVLRESPESRKCPNCYSYSLTDFYASDNNFREIPCGSRKKPNVGMWAGRSHAVFGRQMLIHTHHGMPIPRQCRAVPWPWWVTFRTAWSWHGMWI